MLDGLNVLTGQTKVKFSRYVSLTQISIMSTSY